MVNIDKIIEYAYKKDIKISDGEIKKMIQEQNSEQLFNELATKYRYEIWDKKSDINGVSAQTIIDSRNYKIVSAYLIYIDDKLVYFQDHNPNVEGYKSMTKKEAEQMAKKFIQTQIQENIDIIITHNIINSLMKK